jgi:SAM-dependent methyltransferase
MGDPSQQYGAEAAQVYDETADWPLRRRAEFPTFLAALGPVTGEQVLDLACGTGIVTRLVAGQGAAHVLGVDASEPMIAVARSAGDRGGRVEYRVAEVTTMRPQGVFDAVTTAWLFAYAASRGQFEGFCARVAENLRPGGRLVATVNHPDFDPGGPWDRAYGVTMEMPPVLTDGSPFTFTLHMREPMTFQVHYWSRQAFASALHGAGFGEVSFSPWRPDEEGIRRMGAEYWQPLLANPACAVLTCRKSV